MVPEEEVLGTPFRMAAVGCPLLPVTNWTEEVVVAAAAEEAQVSRCCMLILCNYLLTIGMQIHDV